MSYEAKPVSFVIQTSSFDIHGWKNARLDFAGVRKTCMRYREKGRKRFSKTKQKKGKKNFKKSHMTQETIVSLLCEIVLRKWSSNVTRWFRRVSLNVAFKVKETTVNIILNPFIDVRNKIKRRDYHRIERKARFDVIKHCFVETYEFSFRGHQLS